MIFKNYAEILAHYTSVKKGNYVTPDYILNKHSDGINLFRRYCPHRMYPLADVGNTVENIVCKFHGFEWDKNGSPVNNDRKISCGKAKIGKSGLIFKNFVEPDHYWVDDLAKETNLEYSHIETGKSNGSWLWAMDIQSDLLHIRKGDDVVHPGLSAVTNLDECEMEQGEGWILQTCSTGWWLFIYPYAYVEWSPGCLAINNLIPDNPASEFKFEWITQYYYDPSVSLEKRKEFETLEDVFKEDIATIELQKGKYFPLAKSTCRLEEHSVYFGEWVTKNRRD